MTSQSFTDAQQAANVAYDMTLHETGDIAQASAAYTDVMTAFHAASRKRQIRRGWYSKTSLQDDIDVYGRGAGIAGNEPERCEAGGLG